MSLANKFLMHAMHMCNVCTCNVHNETYTYDNSHLSEQLTQFTYASENFPVSILYKSIAGRYRPVRVADGPITACYRFIKNASWV